jgi:aminopeptidase N
MATAIANKTPPLGRVLTGFVQYTWIRRLTTAVAVVAMALLMSIPSAADQFPRQAGIKILHYGFDVTLGNASDDVAVKDTIDLQFMASGVRGMNLNLCNLIRDPRPENRLNPCLIPPPRPARGSTEAPAQLSPSSVGRGMTVTGVVSEDGEALTFTHENNILHVNFPKESRLGQRLSFTVSYHGVPAAGLYIGKNKYGDRVWFTDNWPNKARNWLATIDHISVKAPKTISVTAPDIYQVISNGKVIEQTDLPGDLRRTVWQESLPIPSWQYALGVGAMAVAHFGQFENTQFSAWVFPQDRDSSFKTLEQRTESIFEFYTDHVGPFDYEKLAQVEATGGGGATEPATTIFYYGAHAYGAQAHEMAHQWFGDAVTESSWDDVWLSEGFATYFNLLYVEHEYGRDAFIAGVERTRDAAMRYESAHPEDTVVHKNLTTASNVFSNAPQIYQGGAMVLHMLRGVLGDADFWAGIRLYYDRFRNGSASSDDLRHAMEDACYASGNCPPDYQDLSWFFREWLNRGGFMHVTGSWHYDPQAKELQVVLDQTESQELYRMPIEIGIALPPGTPASEPGAGASMANTGRGGRDLVGPTIQMATILVDKRHSTLTIPLAVAPQTVQLDPNLWVPMMHATFEKQ